jgi:adenylate kinase family enzyme
VNNLSENGVKLKIGLVGTHEVGKTTLGHILTGYLKAMDYSANLVHEAARLSPFGLLEETTMEAEKWIVNQQINHELVTARFSDILVCDRTSLDTLAYTKYVLDKNPSEENKESYDLINKIVDSNIKSYDVFIYFPIIDKLITKRNKKHNEEFKKQVDNYLIKIMEEKNLDNIHKLKSTSIQGRLEEVMNLCCIDKESFRVVSSDEESLKQILSTKDAVLQKPLEGDKCTFTNQ